MRAIGAALWNEQEMTDPYEVEISDARDVIQNLQYLLSITGEPADAEVLRRRLAEARARLIYLETRGAK